MRILIVDDSGSIRSLLKKRLLQRWPEAEITAYDPVREGRPADTFPWNDFDLLFLDYDLGMGQETGIDWLQQIKQSSNSPYIIIVTGMGSEQVAVRAIREGADDYLIKYDVVTDKLYETVEEYLAQQQAEGSSEGKLSTPPRVDYEEIWQDTRTPADAAGVDPAHWDIPGYKYIAELARKLSITWLVERNEDGKRMVLKVQGLKEDSPLVQLKRFMRELAILSEIDHPHIIKILDRGITDRYFYYAMDYFPQGDLLGVIRGGGVTPEMACSYIVQIADGLGALHRAGIVHRDIKPSNVLFASPDHLVITDLGIAKDLSSAEELTSHGQVMGTPFYMSPEQINSSALDHRSDIYSLGILFYELLTGTLPFPGASIMEVAYMHAYDMPPQLPEGLARFQPIMDWMLAKAPEERYQDLEDLIHDVSAISTG